MGLAHSLRLPAVPVAAIVGAGGKTSALFQIAKELPPPVVVTTTTHIGTGQVSEADRHFIVSRDSDLNAVEEHKSGIMVVTGPRYKERFGALTREHLDWLHNFCISHSLSLLIEADGARRLPLKAPASHEPVIPDFVDTVLVVAGLSALGKPLSDETVYQPALFSKYSRLKPGDRITPGALENILLHPEGGLKGIPEKARRLVLLNQADTPEIQAQANGLARGLLTSYDSAIIASLKTGSIFATREKTAGIILAAGASTRFGQPKQLLDWQGEPLLRKVCRTAIEARLEKIIVITGAHAHPIREAVEDLPIEIAHNENWEAGQSTSIRTGLSIVKNDVGSAIFLLADQPQVTPTLITALAETHARDLPAILAPMIEDRRANPVLFDRAAFPDLMTLTGDIGGRGIFSRHKVTYLPWHDSLQLIDIDTPQDYTRLKEYHS